MNELSHLATAVDSLPPLSYLHDKAYDASRVRPVENINFVKPRGGTWLSRYDVDNRRSAWSDWLQTEGVGLYDGETLYHQVMTLKSDARVLTIDSWSDFQEVLSAYPSIRSDLEELAADLADLMGFLTVTYLDFEKMALDWDAIWLTDRGQIETRFPRSEDGERVSMLSGPSLYGWDLESVLVLNKNAVAKISEPVESAVLEHQQ